MHRWEAPIRPNLTCPCCGYMTLRGYRGGYDCCDVCAWEDCPFQFSNPDIAGGANYYSLRVAQQNFLAYGCCEDGSTLGMARRPGRGDVKDPKWRLLPKRRGASSQPARLSLKATVRKFRHVSNNLRFFRWRVESRESYERASAKYEALKQGQARSDESSPVDQ
ncbi:CPCC family cysteine-rich protein [Denitratimonas tolerans]|uniref:CPCC family cysteine-rich protein n=1 Tax=Denitratimonas tolerans TaxID=1338420 RepID=A0AAW9R5X6_9GAMM